MYPTRYTGGGALAFLQKLLPASLKTLPVPGTDGAHFGSTLSVMLNEGGGIIDDCMITRWGENSYAVLPMLYATRALLTWTALLQLLPCHQRWKVSQRHGLDPAKSC